MPSILGIKTIHLERGIAATRWARMRGLDHFPRLSSSFKSPSMLVRAFNVGVKERVPNLLPNALYTLNLGIGRLLAVKLEVFE